MQMNALKALLVKLNSWKISPEEVTWGGCLGGDLGGVPKSPDENLGM